MTKGVPLEAASSHGSDSVIDVPRPICFSGASNNGITPLASPRGPNGVEMTPPTEGSNRGNFWRKVAVGVRRTFDRACTAAAYDTDRADQATRGACPAGDVRDCGAAEDTAGAVVDLRFITGAK